MKANFISAGEEDLLLAHCHRRRFRKNDILVHAGAASDSLMYLIKGSAVVSLESENGREMVIAHLSPGDFIGEIGVFSPEMPRSAWVRARSDCEVGIISYAQFHDLANSHVEMVYALGRQLVARLLTTTRKASDFAFYDVVGRLERCLVELARPAQMSDQEGVTVRYTRQELASMVGCTREMAGRALKALENANLISIQGQSITVFPELLGAHRH